MFTEQKPLIFLAFCTKKHNKISTAKIWDHEAQSSKLCTPTTQTPCISTVSAVDARSFYLKVRQATNFFKIITANSEKTLDKAEFILYYTFVANICLLHF